MARDKIKMVAILRLSERQGERIGREHQKCHALQEDQPADQGDDHGKHPAGPDVVTDDHRDTNYEADDRISAHDWPIGDRGCNNESSLHHEGRHEHDREKSPMPLASKTVTCGMQTSIRSTHSLTQRAVIVPHLGQR
jgi:hypothetical protein